MRKVLNFVGTGTAFSKDNINNAAFYKTSNKLVLFNCGSTILHEIINKNIIDSRIESIDVIITNLNDSHIGSLGSLILYCNTKNIKEINLIYPNKKMLCLLLEIFGIEKKLFTIKLPNEIKDYYLKEYEYKQEYIHDKDIVKNPSYGYHFINENDNLFYNDNNIISDEILQMFKMKKIYYLYQKIDVEKAILQLNELKNKIEKKYRRRVMFMHQNDDCDAEELEKLGFNTAR